MKRLWLIIATTFLMACHQYPGEGYEGALTVNQVLELNPDAKYFEFNNRVYTKVNWAKDLQLTKCEQIGEIEKGMSNHLPIGTKIFAPKERRDL